MEEVESPPLAMEEVEEARKTRVREYSEWGEEDESEVEEGQQPPLKRVFDADRTKTLEWRNDLAERFENSGRGPGDEEQAPPAMTTGHHKHAREDNYFIKLHLVGDLLLIRPSYVASDDEWSGEDSSSESEEEDKAGAAEEEAAAEDGTVRNRRRKPRKPVKWPKDLVVVKEIDEGGLPTKKRARLRLRLLAGLIARQKIPLVLPGFKSLDKMENWRLFDTWVTPLLKFPEDMKTTGFRQLMMITAKAWRNHKSKLKTHFIKQGLTPFAKYPYIQPEDWDNFVKMIESEEAEKESQRFKKPRDGQRSDMYDLFNVDALDVSLLRFFTLQMVQETKEWPAPVGFLDPELMPLSTIRSCPSYVVEYVTKALQKHSKKKFIMFAHNTIGHWVLVIIIPKWKKVLYFNSLRSQARDHLSLKEVINEAFNVHCTTMKVDNSSGLQHVTKFSCHQQPPGNACGFYVVNHMMDAMELLSIDGDREEEFEVRTNALSQEELHAIHEKIANFLMNQVISEKGEFHWRNKNPGFNLKV
ncbi:hypothetical protein C2845_PM05G17070 [Panicum miliaceum]|uniref:Ubiquitin-like protease family profile domain-containing protein n=1 Tax=Panicum miliaceum TaxID=4540 RepID=A0A3L6SVC4_PANMI|nr:hypothetical protein C2845_PM05G17070 [Panicum miliaceum]